ncbi:MAG: dolichyl-phosphate beta-D-mannosyltransferase [Candidatus Marinimicrobia bacterium]|nr:dolichyl-phosphate beta-D-mannosyltransferase [Candidatus Neomarinimicrobiota bacterium]|tara:strand:+ start:17305 stop:18021 length:717 start_codon:yes stop_codon:yes gene_type:complete
MNVLIIIPTYNESKNIQLIIDKITSIDENYSILIVDDNSPDKTSDIVRNLMIANPNINLLNRKSKQGLGTAYCAGFKWAIDNNFDKVVQIDADLSHNPNDIPNLIEESCNYDLIIGSRYVNGINVVNWPLSRLMLSYFANVYAKFVTGLPIYDSTGGFKCHNINVLKSIDLDKIKSTGYSFQIEMNFITWYKGFSIKETPIIFCDRTIGESKMSKKIVFEAMYMVPILKIKKILRLIK